MYQPKGLDMPQKLTQVAQLATSATYTDRATVDEVAKYLDNAGYSSDKAALLKRYSRLK